tara:strand:+ start:326 stop:436 length:111 start_codon:yes stop_codon:yes gene_type:complete
MAVVTVIAAELAGMITLCMETYSKSCEDVAHSLTKL